MRKSLFDSGIFKMSYSKEANLGYQINLNKLKSRIGIIKLKKEFAATVFRFYFRALDTPTNSKYLIRLAKQFVRLG